jgi:hypothetical protein
MDNLMRFIAATLPDRQREPIKDGFWLLAPSFRCPGFRHWAREFDSVYPGMLVGFASARRDRELLSRAVLIVQGPAVTR